MEFVLSTEEKIDVEEGKKLLAIFSKILTGKGYTILYEEMNEIENSNLPMGDTSIQEETFFQTKIRRMSKQKNCAREVCAIED